MLPSVVAKEVISALIRRAKVSPQGNFVEVGVYKGGTAWHLSKLAEEQNRKIYTSILRDQNKNVKNIWILMTIV